MLVPSGDVRALAGAMHALIESPELRARLGARGRDLIEATASPEIYMHKLTGLIEEAARSHTV